MSAFWVRWFSPLPLETFELHSPWWITGSTAGEETICCAAVHAETAQSAQQIIINAYDNPPKAITFSFCNEQAADWSPFCSRFPRADWMQWETARMKQEQEANRDH